jgi:superfamily II DNA or RNA helicase
MTTNPPFSNNATLRNYIESEIRKEEEAEVGLQVAQSMLGIDSIDKEFRALKERLAETQFQFDAEKSKTLRPYQETALFHLFELLKAKRSTIGLQLPTGAGKTFVIHSYIYRHFLQRSQNVLVITPSWEIANQHAMTVSQHFKDGKKRVRRLGGQGQVISVFDEYESRGRGGKVILTTSALFYARQAQLMEQLKVGLIVIDEGHHGWKKLRLNSVQEFSRTKQIPVVLLTATPPRNMQGLPFAAQLRYLDLVPEYLVPCEVVRLETGQQFDPVLKNGILSQSSRVELSSRKQRFEKIIESSIQHIRGQTIYYAGSVREAMGVMKAFAEKNITAVTVHSKWTAKGDRINALAIEKFRRGEVQVLVNVQMLAMGFDVPNVETIIVARPVESDTLFTQMVGRGARPAPGKDKFILIDVHDTIFKPEVAKIFEHRQLFYNGRDNKQEIEMTISAPPVMPVKKISPNKFLYPYMNSKISDLHDELYDYFELIARDAILEQLR